MKWKHFRSYTHCLYGLNSFMIKMYSFWIRTNPSWTRVQDEVSDAMDVPSAIPIDSQEIDW